MTAAVATPDPRMRAILAPLEVALRLRRADTLGDLELTVLIGVALSALEEAGIEPPAVAEGDVGALVADPERRRQFVEWFKALTQGETAPGAPSN